MESSSVPRHELRESLEGMVIRVLNLSLLVVNGRVVVMENDEAGPELKHFRDLAIPSQMEWQCVN